MKSKLTEEETNAENRSHWDEKMESWKRALSQVVDLKGKDAKNRKEAEFIREIITDIHQRLGVSLSKSLPLLIGMDHYIQFISSWLADGSCHPADILTVVGMGGIGKTSLAKYVYQLHSFRFHKSSFIEGINARCNEQFNGLLDLQKQLHADISKKISLHVNDVHMYTSKIENELARKMVFIVFDDIDSLDQLDALLGNKGLHPGSKIIITTKDASLIKRYTLYDPQVQPRHTNVLLNCLCEAESLELLCIHAFGSQNPKEGYKEVSEKLVKYCDGHPLALEVLGKSLSKYEDAHEWEYYIEVLKKEPHSRIIKALQMSFDSLTFNNDKDLFKHIACFFVGIDKDLTETILKSCGIKTRFGIKNLIDRRLLGIGWDNKLMMHQLVQEMGRDLVRKESVDKPQKRSWLWCHEESFKVLKHKKGKRNLLGLALDMRMLEKKKCGSFTLKTSSLRKMDNLMLLQLNYIQLKRCFRTFPKELRWLCMRGFPLKSLHLDLPMKNLVYLDLSYSNIESFGMSYSMAPPPAKRQKLVGSCSKVKRLLGSLKILDLSFCKKLRNISGFLELPTLERLIVVNCINLIEVCESLDQCIELVHINLSYCLKLKKLPISIVKLKKVQTLSLDGCNFCESQIKMCDTSSSDISVNSETSSSTIINALPCDFKFFVSYLPSSLIVLSLANNNLSIESFPRDFSCLSMLEELCLDDNPIVSMPNCVRSLPKLKTLSMENCEMIILIEHPPCTLRVLSVGHGNTSLRKIKFNPEMSPINIDGPWKLLSTSSYEIDGMIKIQRLAHVEEKVLHILGWKNLDFIKERRLKTFTFGGSDKSQTKMYNEFGIFSTMYHEEKGMPNWIRNTRKGPSISFSIASSPKKIKGLNFCCMETMHQFSYDTFVLPKIIISNVTKKQTWIYNHYIDKVKVGGKCLNMLSHWMFGPNEMTASDQITINVTQRYYNQQFTKKCGVIYDDGKVEEEDDELASSEKEVSFKAFSQKNPRILGHASQIYTWKLQHEKTTTRDIKMDTNLGHDPAFNVIRGKSVKKLAKKSSVGMKSSRSEMRNTGRDDKDVHLRRQAISREQRNRNVDKEVDARIDNFVKLLIKPTIFLFTWFLLKRLTGILFFFYF
ncbi:hypothetical protein E3N88_13889 [Mikania micrantha]|uniref:Uncharacterized protein n=1 Tax=Mikania micrantha TaxID=192012 RepID=A0A5N6NZW4_9ASTR|nr:hypothetical protein E3N88_13889 [Mikania micrantha]